MKEEMPTAREQELFTQLVLLNAAARRLIRNSHMELSRNPQKGEISVHERDDAIHLRRCTDVAASTVDKHSDFCMKEKA